MEILHVERSCGNSAEVCYFGSNVTNTEKCQKEFTEFRIICWKEKKNATQGKVADLAQST